MQRVRGDVVNGLATTGQSICLMGELWRAIQVIESSRLIFRGVEREEASWLRVADQE